MPAAVTQDNRICVPDCVIVRAGIHAGRRDLVHRPWRSVEGRRFLWPSWWTCGRRRVQRGCTDVQRSADGRNHDLTGVSAGQRLVARGEGERPV